ncbi:MAG: NfeD family protein [Kiritimatiellaeota bacterium]|nr:NfeD family protein [Kiritimatiellota bacterium]
MALWQIWLAAGILLMILEVATPGFVMFFFGVAAFLMVPVVLIAPKLGILGQCVFFTVLSLVGIAFFRTALCDVFAGKKIGRDNVMKNDFAGKVATVIERVTPQTPGKVEFNGTHWRAVSNATLEPGATVTVTAQDNLTLTVEPR